MTEDTVGTMIPLKFLEVDQAKNRLVVSNRRAVVETKLVNLEPGQLVTGIVRSIKPYGMLYCCNVDGQSKMKSLTS